MKQRFFMLMATVLLMSTSVFAQNTENWDGDVNKDGVVDVADINAVIYLMKEAAGEYDGRIYYYYAGVTDKVSFTLSDLTLTTTTRPTTLTFDGAYGENYQTFIFPTSWGKPTSMMAGGLDGKGGWTWGDSYVTVPSGYTCASAQGGAVTYTITWE